jgi:hypothetical protein
MTKTLGRNNQRGAALGLVISKEDFVVSLDGQRNISAILAARKAAKAEKRHCLFLEKLFKCA